jgi:DNA polymerase elongation subunit (family B)
MTPLRKAIDEGSLRGGFSRRSYNTNQDYTKQAQIELGLTMCGWFSVSGLTQQSATRISSCRQEFVVKDGFAQVKAAGADEAPENGSFRVMSFDIEMAGRRGIFPDPEIDPIIQISSIVESPQTGKVHAYRLFTWKPTEMKQARLYGGLEAEIVICLNEADMLRRWLCETRYTDTDIYTGWGIDNFDIFMIVKRCEKFHIDPKPLGRLLGAHVTVKESQFQSKAYGKRAQTKLQGVSGCVVVDMMKGIVMREHKLRSYALKDSARHFLAMRNCFDLEDCEATEDAEFVIYGVSEKKPYRVELLDAESNEVLFVQEGVKDADVKIRFGGLKLEASRHYRLRIDRPVMPNLLYVETTVGGQPKFYICNRSCDINKVDLHYTKISEHWNSESNELRGDLAYYCCVDAELPLEIMKKIKTIENLIAMGEVTGVNMTTLTQVSGRAAPILPLEAHVFSGRPGRQDADAARDLLPSQQFHRRLSAQAHSQAARQQRDLRRPHLGAARGRHGRRRRRHGH